MDGHRGGLWGLVLHAQSWPENGFLETSVMQENDYFDAHIPHRVNLLIAFRQRYSGRDPQKKLDPERYRDLFRCAKDVSFVMVRFFCDEMGVVLAKNDLPNQGVKADEIYDPGKWMSKWGTKKIDLTALKSDKRHAALVEVLKAANRAVAHMDDKDVDHQFKIDSDNERIFSVVDWIEEMIKTNIYQAAGKDFDRSMSLPNNVM